MHLTVNLVRGSSESRSIRVKDRDSLKWCKDLRYETLIQGAVQYKAAKLIISPESLNDIQPIFNKQHPDSEHITC